jgi:hypothetical protein
MFTVFLSVFFVFSSCVLCVLCMSLFLLLFCSFSVSVLVSICSVCVYVYVLVALYSFGDVFRDRNDLLSGAVVLDSVFHDLLALFAPFTPYISEEIHSWSRSGRCGKERCWRVPRLVVVVVVVCVCVCVYLMCWWCVCFCFVFFFCVLVLLFSFCFVLFFCSLVVVLFVETGSIHRNSWPTLRDPNEGPVLVVRMVGCAFCACCFLGMFFVRSIFATFCGVRSCSMCGECVCVCVLFCFFVILWIMSLTALVDG